MKVLNVINLFLIGFVGLPFIATAQTAFQVSKESTSPSFAMEINDGKRVDLQNPHRALKPHRENSDLFAGFSADQAIRYQGSSESIRNMVKATQGGVAGGGGTEKEGDFASLARILYRHLAKDKMKSSEVLGFDITEFQEAIDKTEPHCAADPYVLMLMRELRKAALFTTQPIRIQLDCDNYENAKKNGDLGPITIFHEYMRSIGRDTSAYEASSKLLMIFYDAVAVKDGLAMLLTEPANPNKYSCESREQSELLVKMDACFRPGSGSDPISSGSFNGKGATFQLLEFYKCLSRTYKTAKADETMDIYWSDIYFLTSEYFKYDLTADRGHQKQRCGLAGTLNKYVIFGEPR